MFACTRLAFTVVVGATDNLAMVHVGTLLASTLRVHLAHLIVAFNCIAAHLLTIAFLLFFLRLFQCNNLLHLLDGHVVNMMIGTGTGHTGSLNVGERERKKEG